MKKLISVILAALILFAAIPFVYASPQGTVYYVDAEGGNDENDGTSPSGAWKTVAKASSVTYSAGDSILFKAGGIFSGGFTANGSGEQGKEITVSSYGDTASLGKPLIRSDGNDILMNIHNVSYWCVSGIDFTAPEGRGVYITADGESTVTGITVENCGISNVYNHPGPFCDHFAINLASGGPVAVLDGITIRDCSIEKCSFGINMAGRSIEATPDWFVSPEESYNRNFIIDGVSLSDIWNDAVIIGSIYGMVIRNCSLINTSIHEDHFTAPMWSHHASNYVIENCEIAGATNTKDGMSVDFDGWTTDATYQYIYSHDNVRFIRNCCYDNYTRNDNCTVRYCLSVNDNKGGNEMAQMLSSSAVDYADDQWAVEMTNFRFYNNTIINSSYFKLTGLKDAIIANNIFTGNPAASFLTSRKSIGENDEPVIHRFDGVITNNCFSGTGVPMGAENSIFANPSFVSDDIEDRNSFMLSESSPLIGKGIQVEDDMGETDFYGNALTSSHNIGCYDGKGEKGGADAVKGFFRNVISIIGTILGRIYTFIDNCNNTYWLF